MYYVLSKDFPFKDDNIEVLFDKVVLGEFDFSADVWEGISDEAKDLISHLLDVNPNQRYDFD
jgi:serine/threonine-protein kinase RCK2